MAGWSGFTDEELHKLKQETNGTDLEKQQHAAKTNATRKEKKRRTNVKTAERPTEQMDKSLEIEAGQKKSARSNAVNNNQTKNGNHKIVEKNHKQSNDKHTCYENVQHAETRTGKEDQINIEEIQRSSDIKEQNPHYQKEDSEIRIISDKDAIEIQMTELEKLQRKQKEIEEENKVKKKIITETISERYKKAQNEALTLQTVQKELSKLDCLLANDVEILRIKIEEAAISYCHAQKRYERAEKEFVNSKFDLKLKEERKEELTQHLYTIIQENELRKAKKLEELMSKLDLPKDVIKEGLQAEKNEQVDNSSVGNILKVETVS